MKELISFHTEHELNNRYLKQFLTDQLVCDNLIWIEDFRAYSLENDLDETKTYVENVMSEYGFRYHYTVYNSELPKLPLDEKVELLKVLAMDNEIQLLVSDDEKSLTSWILIEADGTKTHVETDPDNEELVLQGF